MTVPDHDQNTTAPWARALSFPAVLRDGRRVRMVEIPVMPDHRTPRMSQEVLIRRQVAG